MKRTLILENQVSCDDTKFYEWWFVLGAFYYLQDIFNNWLNETKSGSIGTIRKNIPHFSIVCLMCSGDSGWGFTIQDLRKIYDKFTVESQNEGFFYRLLQMKKFYKSSICGQIFKEYETSSKNVGDSPRLFNMPVTEQHGNLPWLMEFDCKCFQQGLRDISINQESTMILLNKFAKNHLTNFENLYFASVFDFAAWINDNRQEKVLNLLGHRVFQQIQCMGKNVIHLSKINRPRPQSGNYPLVAQNEPQVLKQHGNYSSGTQSQSLYQYGKCGNQPLLNENQTQILYQSGIYSSQLIMIHKPVIHKPGMNERGIYKPGIHRPEMNKPRYTRQE